MTHKAAISASLVDVRNIAAHKCVRLEIHVPVEQAPLVMAAFGWPTMVDPVPVALVRLDLNAVKSPQPPKEKRDFCDLPFSQQAALKSNDARFAKYLGVSPGEECAAAIRQKCGVDSRSKIIKGTWGGSDWIELLREFERHG